MTFGAKLTMKSQKSATTILLLAGAVLLLPLVGCEGNAPVTEDKAVTDKRLQATKTIRSMFDKAHGKYEALSAEDKEALDKVTGSEENSKKAFSLIH